MTEISSHATSHAKAHSHMSTHPSDVSFLPPGSQGLSQHQTLKSDAAQSAFDTPVAAQSETVVQFSLGDMVEINVHPNENNAVKKSSVFSISRELVSTNWCAPRRQQRNRQTRGFRKHFFIFDVFILGAFVVVLLISVYVGVYINNRDIFPDNLERLNLGDTLEIGSKPGDQIFFDITLPSAIPVAIYISSPNKTFIPQPIVDTSITVFERPNKLVDFDDDFVSGNVNPALLFLLEEQKEFLLRIDTIRNEGIYFLNVVEVEERIEPDITLEVFVQSRDFFFATLDNLLVGQPYDVMAYLKPSVRDAYSSPIDVEADTAISIHRANGEKIIEVVQSTVSEFTARVLFTPDSAGPFIINVRILSGGSADIFVLVRTAETEVLHIDRGRNIQEFELSSQIATILEFTVEQDIEYEFDIQVETNRTFGLDLLKVFGYTYDDVFLPFYTNFRISIPGISIRIFDKIENEIIQRERTEIQVVNQSNANFFTNGYQNQYAEFIVEDNSTRFNLQSLEERTILLDISRWDVDYSFNDISQVIDNPFFGRFTVRVVQKPLELPNRGNSAVDPTNIYPECEIDSIKFTIGDNQCEKGIALYCRNEFAKFKDELLHSKQDFSEVCTCVDYLCAALTRGDNQSNELGKISQIFHILFTALSVLGILIYLLAHVKLVCKGKFRKWVTESKIFTSWTLMLCFFMSTTALFISELKLIGEFRVMEEISGNFSEDSLESIISVDNIRYYYYLREEIIENEIPDDLIQSIGNQTLFGELGISSDKALPFKEIQDLINFNLFSSVIKDVLATVVFLDVSTVWIAVTSSPRLNKAKAERAQKCLKNTVRSIEILYLATLLIMVYFLALTNGEAYNNLPNVLSVLTSLLVIHIYWIGRIRVRTRFSETNLLSEAQNSSLWYTIRNVSSIVMVSNVGIIITQIFSIATIQDFEDLVEASNDPLYQSLLLMQHACLFCAMLAVMMYILRQYSVFRKTVQ